jgi:hypothetical protein
MDKTAAFPQLAWNATRISVASRVKPTIRLLDVPLSALMEFLPVSCLERDDAV